MNKNILVTKKFFDTDIDYIRAGIHPSVNLVIPQEFSVESLRSATNETIHGFLGPVIDEEMLKRSPSLRFIQIPWTGVDNLDFEILKKYPVTVCNSHSNARVVAEYSIGLMFSLIKSIPLHDRRLRSGNWSRPSAGNHSDFNPPVLLSGRTIGFLGYGAIASAITSMLAGFDLKFIAIASKSKKVPPNPVEYLGGPGDIDSVIKETDILFITLPLTSTTRNLITEEKFNIMKNSSYLVNIARGEIINEEALYRALSERRIAGGAIDTWYNYPGRNSADVLPSLRFPFHELENCVLSPHRAGFAQNKMPHLDDAIDNLNRYAAGKPLKNIVDVHKGY